MSDDRVIIIEAYINKLYRDAAKVISSALFRTLPKTYPDCNSMKIHHYD
jgi:hypothetical protein